ncbi:hypothetical protein [Haloarchaeobius sp. DYHT-AS-18]|uniref:hypothetical protein n=1 Tax=Haloarchaeobius sp. DYHT-AS-18 TaxID=3446117 RepID=UPI003EBBFEAA
MGELEAGIVAIPLMIIVIGVFLAHLYGIDTTGLSSLIQPLTVLFVFIALFVGLVRAVLN